MIDPDAAFPVALEHALDAVDDALAALNAVERPDIAYVQPLIEAQKHLAHAIKEWEGARRAS